MISYFNKFLVELEFGEEYLKNIDLTRPFRTAPNHSGLLHSGYR